MCVKLILHTQSTNKHMTFFSHKFCYCLCGYHCSFLGLYYFYLIIILRSKSMQPTIKKVGLIYLCYKYLPYISDPRNMKCSKGVSCSALTDLLRLLFSVSSKSRCPLGQRRLRSMAAGQGALLEVGALGGSTLAKPLYLQRLERALKLDSFLRQTSTIFNKDIPR